MVADSTIVSNVLENISLSVGIIFLSYMTAKTGGFDPSWVNSGERKALGTPGFIHSKTGTVIISQ
jgi:hypothetical protein